MRVYLPAGWIDFDPTNSMVGIGIDRVAVAWDPARAAALGSLSVRPRRFWGWTSR
jgi:transglutaminase-like putative cysteine protease